MPSTRAVHAGKGVDAAEARPTAAPIHVATAFSYPDARMLDDVFEDNSRGYVYSRYGNPTVRSLEQAIAVVEQCDEAIAFASGMAAIHAAITGVAGPGAKILASQDLYGATHALLRTHFASINMETHFVDMLDLDAVRDAATAIQPAIVLAESISNPLIRVTDIAAVAEIAHGAGARLIIDNTFASPVIIRPAALGADLVVHSTTKFIAGHGDTTGGVIATSSRFAGPIREQAKLFGAVTGPFDAFLAIRGLKTLDLRVRQQSRNARKIATTLTQDSRIERVNYPGLGSAVPDPLFLCEDRGALLSFEIAGAGREEIFAFMDALKLCIPATTLGDVFSLVLYPAMSSHRSLTPEQRHAIGIRDNLVRMSVGIEDPRDILADVNQALATATG
ncbi:MAG TPA: PLP-dependent aspartate aminotransferase family protein [Thermomicrobiales bacterium]|nr:PLP-dependent aspartate aminotransferase family protein [Thermomicrobiales bacterium]